MADLKLLRPRILQAIVKCCFQELTQLLTAVGEENAHYGVQLSCILLAEADVEVAQALMRSPSAFLAALDDCLLDAQECVLAAMDLSSESACAPVEVKHNAHVRLHSVPHGMDPQSDHNPVVSGIRARHMHQLVTVNGTVVRCGAIKMFESQQMFECTRCKESFLLRCTLDQGGVPQMPEECPRRSAPCAGSNFRHVKDTQMYTAYQEVRLQEKMQSLAMGALPCSITVLLQDELADACRPGDDVTVVAVVLPQWRPLIPGKRCEAELVLVACHVHLASIRTDRVDLSPEMEADFKAFWLAHADKVILGRNKILASFCPQVFGLFLVKLAAVLAIVGGVPREAQDGTRVRGEVHLLLIGDPGTGKSQVMKFACRVSHRSVSATGRGSSGAGLTAVAVKEAGGGGWCLEAGALVLADGGLCCIDEFEGIKEGDRAALHEAMEQQTVHVAKAGLVATLSTRTTVMAATNPKRGYKSGQPLAVMTTISGPLLSRFDLLLVLEDERSITWDKRVSDQILNNHAQPPSDAGGMGQASSRPPSRPAAAAASGPSSRPVAAAAASGPSTRPAAAANGSSSDDPSGSGTWSIEVLQMYLLWVKSTFRPRLTYQAEHVLKSYYALLRGDMMRNAARTTIRMLESLVRVAQAHARLTGQHTVNLRDAIVAVLVVDASQNVLFHTGPASAVRSEFAEDPELEYRQVEARVLAELPPMPPPPPPASAAAPEPSDGGGAGGTAGAARAPGGRRDWNEFLPPSEQKAYSLYSSTAGHSTDPAAPGAPGRGGVAAAAGGPGMDGRSGAPLPTSSGQGTPATGLPGHRSAEEASARLHWGGRVVGSGPGVGASGGAARGAGRSAGRGAGRGASTQPDAAAANRAAWSQKRRRGD